MKVEKSVAMIKYFKYPCVAVVLLLPTLASKADYISLIQADKCETLIEIFVYEDSVRLTLEIGERDYEWFKNTPSAWHRTSWCGTSPRRR